MKKNSKNKSKLIKKGDKFILTGLLCEADKPNANGIAYSREAIEKMAEDFNKRIDAGEIINGNAYFKDNSEDILNIGKDDIRDISHTHKKLKVEDEGLYASINLLATPKGNQITELLKLEDKHFETMEFEFAPRYVGDKLISFDIVKGMHTSMKGAEREKL